MEKKEIKLTYTYDPLNRLSSVAVNGKTKKYYDYDRAGNLIRISSDPPEKPSEPALDKETEKAGLLSSEEPALQEKPATGWETGVPSKSAARDGRFAALEEKYEQLNMEAQTGAISPEQFQEKVNGLRFEDAGGTWWQLRHDGAWIKWNGAAWVEAEPVS